MHKKLLTTLAIGLALVSFHGCGDDSFGGACLSDEANNTQTGTQESNQTILADGSIQYTDIEGKLRVAPATLGAAEYHAGMDFNHTMFDSAEKKCQNCHNELYDTWKDSMHAKSWKDPIFQSKFQDFLRTHLAKIGSNPTDELEYSEKKFKGVAQTCIKCHAPGAYYSGDFQVTLESLKTEDVTTADLDTAKANHQSNSMATTGAFDPTQATSVVSVSKFTQTLYKATVQIGHQANQEGINCAFCHSMETIRMISENGADNGLYTLKDALREGPVGGIKKEAGETLAYHKEATDLDMNAFFRLWGPEKYQNPANTPKSSGFDEEKAKDGRYTMHSVDLNGTDGKVHYTGGPFYGPYGVTGISNENEDDEANRTAHINPLYHKETNNHFGNHAKALCLSCHQRSAGAINPNSDGTAGKNMQTDSFMELCSTWNAVTTGDDTNNNDSMSSPKCQKCHMERIEGTLVHQWAKPSELFTKSNHPTLTEHFDPDNTEVADNPVRDKWLNSHAFLGASKTGHKASVTAKIKSGFHADLEATNNNGSLQVNASLQNLTAHMFPGAHPMRRVLTRVIVTDSEGNMIPLTRAVGNSTFGDITNTIQTLQGKTLHETAQQSVEVQFRDKLKPFPGMAIDLNGSDVTSQKFSGESVTITAPDGTVTSQTVNADGAIEGSVKNAAIVTDSNQSTFTRIYGHETGKIYNDTFVVRPGFDSNVVANDNRLAPNETETYTLMYDTTDLVGINVTYKVYYMQKGANGTFITGDNGFLDQAASDAKKLLVTEVFSKTVSFE